MENVEVFDQRVEVPYSRSVRPVAWERRSAVAVKEGKTWRVLEAPARFRWP